MGLRLACSWLVDEMVDRALWRIATPAERVSEAERNHAAAVAEVEAFLTEDFEEGPDESLADRLELMGGEVAA